jgi:hypothetical protein
MESNIHAAEPGWYFGLSMADGTGFTQNCNEDAASVCHVAQQSAITLQTCSGLRIEPLVLYPHAVVSDISELVPCLP